MPQKLILSSSSPARRELLARLQIPFEYISPDIDETPLPNEKIPAMVLRLAEAKARKSAQHFPDALIIGCDQVGELENQILSKPLTEENAIKQLKFMSDKEIIFYTGMCLLDASTNQIQTAVETYKVKIRKLTDVMIQNYLQKEKPLQCAGSIHVEGLGISLIEKLSGDDYTALIGLPLIRLTKMLEQANVAFV